MPTTHLASFRRRNSDSANEQQQQQQQEEECGCLDEASPEAAVETVAGPNKCHCAAARRQVAAMRLMAERLLDAGKFAAE